MWRRRALMAATLAAGSMGARCSSTDIASPGAAQTQDPETRALWMKHHFKHAKDLKDAIVIGKLDTVREVAGWLIDSNKVQAHPLEWRTETAQLMAWGEAAATATDIDDAALAVSGLSASCGSCHSARGANLHIQIPQEPGPASSQMQHYRFAIDRMWEGLVAPSQLHWTYGATLYASSLTCPMPDDSSAQADVAPFHAIACNSVLALAATAKAASTPDARVHAFADVVRFCAGCHEARSRLQLGQLKPTRAQRRESGHCPSRPGRWPHCLAPSRSSGAHNGLLDDEPDPSLCGLRNIEHRDRSRDPSHGQNDTEAVLRRGPAIGVVCCSEGGPRDGEDRGLPQP